MPRVKVKCRTCGTGSNVGYAPFPGTIPGAAGGGHFICGDRLYIEQHPDAVRVDRPFTRKQNASQAEALFDA